MRPSRPPPIPGTASTSAVTWGLRAVRSNWSGPDIWNASGLAKQIDTFTEAGSFLGGFQGGYNLLLPSRVLLGMEGDVTFPAFPDISGQSTGVTANFNSLSLGPATYMESIQASTSLRGRVGYVFDNNWLLYATGGAAWSRNSQTLTAAVSGTTDNPFFWRHGWTVGGGVEIPLIPNWTARLEYLYSYFGTKPVNFLANGETFRSDFAPQVLRFALNYHFGDTLPVPALAAFSAQPPSAWTLTDDDRINFHAQATEVAQGYPKFPAAWDGPNSLSRVGDLRQTSDVTLYSGPAPLAGCGVLGQSGDRPGFRRRQHAWRGRLSKRQILQARRRLPLCARAARLRAPDARSGRRETEGRGRHQSIRKRVHRESAGLHGRQIRRQRHFRHEQIRQQSQDRFPQLGADQHRHVRLCRRRLGLHLRRGGRMVSGPFHRARREFSTSRRRPRAGRSMRRPMASTPI